MNSFRSQNTALHHTMGEGVYVEDDQVLSREIFFFIYNSKQLWLWRVNRRATFNIPYWTTDLNCCQYICGLKHKL